MRLPVSNLIQEQYQSIYKFSCSLPPIEAILEALLTKTNAEVKLKDEPLVLVNDAVNHLTGNTISFLEFT